MFKSDNFIFRRTALGEALIKAGVAEASFMIREATVEAMLRDNNDNRNIRPSRLRKVS